MCLEILVQIPNKGLYNRLNVRSERDGQRKAGKKDTTKLMNTSHEKDLKLGKNT
jgi:hypothetical protein